MKIWARVILLSVTLLVTRGGAVEQTTAADSVAYPSRVPDRSTWEEAAALPGRLVFVPVQVIGFGARKTATLVWEDRLLRRAKEALTFADGRIGVRPLASSLRGSGARVFVNDIHRGVDADITSTLGASATKRQHQLLRLSAADRPSLHVYYRSEPHEGFYGAGPTTREDDKTSFRQRDVYLQLTSRRVLDRHLDLHWDVNLHRTRISPGESRDSPSTQDIYPSGTLPGLDDRLVFVAAGLTLRALYVDVPGSPTRGHRSRVRLAYRQSIDGDDFSHVQIGLLTEPFLELFYRRTISVQLGADWRFAPFGNDVPFYDLASLGGTEALRGYKRGRFRDRGATYVVGTYKFPVWKLIEGVVFCETGRVFARVADFGFHHWASSYGAGLRVWVPRAVLFELSLARSGELARLHFSFATTF
jgi:hypothetical protein